MTDFLDKVCPCSECATFAQNEAEQVSANRRHSVSSQCAGKNCTYEVGGRWSCEYEPIAPVPCATQPDRTEMKTIGLGECSSCRTFDCWLHYLRWEVRTGMTLNKAQHHLVTFERTALGRTDAIGHDRDEAERNRRDAVMLLDQGWAAPPNSQTCSLCSAVHGRWSKVHCTNVTDKEPCKGSW